MRVAAVAAGVLLAWPAEVSAAQLPEGGSLVRIEVCGFECLRRTGLFLGADQFEVAIYPTGAAQPQRFPIGDITEFSVHRGKVRSRRIGATLGGLAGLLIGGAVFFAGRGDCDGPVDFLCGISGSAAYAGMLGSGVAGGLLGAIVGMPVERWEPVRLPGMRVSARGAVVSIRF